MNTSMSSPPTTCTLVFFRRKDEILLALKKRGFGVGRWNGVGGKLESGETMDQALVRECQEEISITPLSWRKVAIHDFIMNDNSTEHRTSSNNNNNNNPGGPSQTSDSPSLTSDQWHMHVHVFICEKWQGEPQETDEMAPQWFKLTDIPYDKMWSDDIVWLPQVLQNKLLHCTFHFNSQDEMTKASFEIVDGIE